VVTPPYPGRSRTPALKSRQRAFRGWVVGGLLVAAAGVLAGWLARHDRPAYGAADAAPTVAGRWTRTATPGARVSPASPTAAQAATAAALSHRAVSATGELVDTTPVDQRQAAKIARGLSANPGGGILVEGAPPGSVAGQLRLQVGDVIMAVNGDAVSTPEQFARIYREQGLPRQLTIIRDGREMHRH
jgi:membrane-associated protease RseP (regulator of RpoE activity)